jgi:methylmalonyl-CoA mutase N-terminal domain/subunit
MQDEIEKAAFEWATSVDSGEKTIVGLNKFADAAEGEPEVFPIDPELERQQGERLRALRERRDDAAVKAALEDVRAAARGTQNLLPPMKEALRRYATLGEVSDVLRDEFGVYQPAR